MSDLSNDELLPRLKSLALSPMPRGQFEIIRDAIHRIEDLTPLVEPMSALVHWHDKGGGIDESWWDAAREAIQKVENKMSDTTLTKDSLLSCPFCGWAAMPSEGKDQTWPHVVKCTNCRAQTDDSPTPEAAVNLWNMRVSA